jgi:hypothetical protein
MIQESTAVYSVGKKCKVNREKGKTNLGSKGEREKGLWVTYEDNIT